MATRVNVTSLDALSDFRANLILYVSKAKPALEEVNSDVNRLRVWIEVTQRGYWMGVMKQRARALEEARAAVFSAKLSNFREVASAEQIALTKAKRAYDEAEAKLRVIKKWSRDFDNRVEPLAKQLDKVHTILAEDMASAIHSLTETVRALDEYAGMIAPSMAVETAPPTDAIAAALAEPAAAEEAEEKTKEEAHPDTTSEYSGALSPSLPRSGGEGRGEEATIRSSHGYLGSSQPAPQPSPASSSQEREKTGAESGAAPKKGGGE